MKAFWIYTGLRIGLFVAVFAVLAGLWLIFSGLNSNAIFVLVVASAVGSSLLSLRLLRGPRLAFADRVSQRAERASSKFDELRAKEDAD